MLKVFLYFSKHCTVRGEGNVDSYVYLGVMSGVGIIIIRRMAGEK
jgi:hypothetical protein